jgi:hypothetical protein
MRRTFLLLFSAAVALLLVCGAVLTLPSEKPDDTPMVDGHVRAILFTEVPGKTRFCEVNKMPIYTLSECSQNRPPYCIFSGLGDCPNKIILPFPSPEKMPTRKYVGQRRNSSNPAISSAGQTNNGRLRVSLAERLLRGRAALEGFQSEQIAQVS